jgi:small-conductance mechanosensitive channel
MEPIPMTELIPVPDGALPVWAVGMVIATVCWLLLTAVRRFLITRLGALAGRTANPLDDLLVDVLGRTRTWFIGLVSLLAGAGTLPWPLSLPDPRGALGIVGLGVQTGLWLSTLLVGLLRMRIRGEAATSVAGQTTVGALRFLILLAVWSGVVLLVLANIGVDVTALIAGLGVGGVAVALAVQNILGDLFASLSIVLDRPFEVGDFIVVDDLMGTVENVGLKTTRVRSLSGEQLVFSNANLLSARIRNYQRLQERRVVFAVGVTYQTPPAQVRAIPALIREAIEAAPLTRFDRAHFKAFGDSALEFEAVYYVLDADYNRYMETQEAINLELLDRLMSRKIEFAYPTRTLHLIHG